MQPGGCKKNPRLPEHIKIRKSVAAFALAICPQIVIAQGLGSRNIARFCQFDKIFAKKMRVLSQKNVVFSYVDATNAKLFLH